MFRQRFIKAFRCMCRILDTRGRFCCVVYSLRTIPKLIPVSLLICRIDKPSSFNLLIYWSRFLTSSLANSDAFRHLEIFCMTLMASASLSLPSLSSYSKHLSLFGSFQNRIKSSRYIIE